MASEVIFTGYQDVTARAEQTPPVDEAERGINPGIVGGLQFPPPYAGAPPALANLATGPIFGGFGVIPAIGASAALPPATGFICGGFEEVIYDRIHVIPSLLALGNVLAEQTQEFDVWNAHRRAQKTLASIAELDTDGLTLVEPGATPLLFEPLQLLDYAIIVGTVGPAVINALYTFDFTLESPTLVVTGDRVIAFTFDPERPITEALEWDTNLMKSFDGDEHRLRVRKLPRQLFNMRYLITDDNERSRALNLLFDQSGKTLQIPMFQWSRPLDSDVTAGATVLPVNTVDADYRDSTADFQSLVILWRSATDFEIVEVAVGGIAASSITLLRPLEQDHDRIDTVVAPMQAVVPRDPIEWAETSNNVLTIAVGWLTTDVTDLADLSSLGTLDGIPILDDLNFMDRTLDQSLRRDYDFLDSGSGVFEILFGRTVPEYATMKGFQPQTEAAAFELRKILYGLSGRQKSFWLPTFREDFKVTTGIGAGDVIIEVEDAGYDRFVDAADPWAGIMIELFDGTRFFRQIVSSTPAVGGTETITIDSVLGSPVAVVDIRRASLMIRSRFNTDRIEIEHLQIGHLRVRIPVVGVKQ